jgi:C4-dicarboxylate-binding protein DctP
MDRVYQRQLKESGLEIYYPTQAERDLFRNKANMPDIWRELCAPWLKKHFPKQDMTKQILDELERIKIEVQGK